MVIDKIYMMYLKKFTFFIIGTILITNITPAQQVPLTPISNSVFTPFLINPAISGSKDFMAFDLSGVIQGDNYSQLLSANTRIAKKGPTYFGAPVSKSYTNLGVGAALYNDVIGPARNIGITAAASYHVPLSSSKLTFLSGGVAIKGIYNIMDSLPEREAPAKRFFIPNIDAGVYFYGQKFFAGLSVTNILGSLIDSIDMSVYNVPVSRQYFLLAGYKFVVSRSLNIIIEPSLIINMDDSLSFDKKESYNPMLKIYMESFCIGGYLHNYDNLTFFFQYKFPRLYLGALVDFPRDVPFYKKELTIELAAGINFGSIHSLSGSIWHW